MYRTEELRSRSFTGTSKPVALTFSRKQVLSGVLQPLLDVPSVSALLIQAQDSLLAWFWWERLLNPFPQGTAVPAILRIFAPGLKADLSWASTQLRPLGMDYFAVFVTTEHC